MQRVRVSPDGSGHLVNYVMLSKPELAALMAVADKNPRSQFVWFDYDTISAWGVAANRALRVTANGDVATAWTRCPIKALKDAKPLQKDKILLRSHAPDVTEIVVVRFHGTGGTLVDDEVITPVPAPTKENPNGLPGKGVLQVEPHRVSLAPQGSAEYRVAEIEAFFAMNTGAMVPKVTLPPEHIGPVDKMAKALGKGAKAGIELTPGRGDAPCVWRGVTPDGIRIDYAVLDKPTQL